MFVYPLALGLFLSVHQDARFIRLGVWCVLAGEMLRLWAAGYVGHRKVNRTEHRRGEPKIGALITAGPYAYVRHPLYVGTFLIGLGFCLIAGNLWLMLGALVCFLVVYPKKAAEEEHTIRGEWGEQFDAYRRRVGAWFPRLHPHPDRVGRWSWQGIYASQEVKTVVWLVVVLTALYLREEWFFEHEPLRWKHALFLSGAVGLIGFDLGTEWMRIGRRATTEGSRGE
jgi:protein-S-isoprenylcysteine O-methyltransferase Ste14